MQKTTNLLFVIAGTALLAGCGSTKLIGDKSLPDETQVIDGPGLVLPPDFDLRPPREAQDYESMLRTQKNAEAQSLITGVSGTTAGATTAHPDDAWLLKQAGGTVQPGIRDKLSGEVKTDKAKAKAEAHKDDGLLKRWFSGFGSSAEDDADEE
ncbi:MAG TPA: DUF3035 domain-containing protein [Alphaproteobacteria bacterium]|nr:DUF3035 domain-containing protein [Alphaproteobacteria bacterium]